MTESKVMHLAEKGGAWTGTIGGEDVTFVIHGEVTGIELFDRCLDDDEIRKAFKDKPKTKTIYKWAYKDCSGDWMQTSAYLEDEKEAKRWSERMYGVDMLQYIKRLDYTAIEVES